MSKLTGAALLARALGEPSTTGIFIATAWWHRRAVPLRWSFIDRAPTTEATGSWDVAGIDISAKPAKLTAPAPTIATPSAIGSPTAKSLATGIDGPHAAGIRHALAALQEA